MYFLLYYVVFVMRNNLQWSNAKRSIYCIILHYIIKQSDFTCARGAMYIDITMDIVHL